MTKQSAPEKHIFYPREHSYMTSDFQLGKQVGHAASDFIKQTYVVKYLIRVGKQVKNAPKTSDIVCEGSLKGNIYLYVFLFFTDTYITKLDLVPKRNVNADKLSGGMKRKLHLGLIFL